MTISEKVSYIKGLAEGMKIDENTNEGKLLLTIMDILGDVALDLEDIDAELDDMAEVVSDLEEGVCDLEDAVYGDEDDEDDGAFDDEDDEDLYEITCPKCDNTLTVDFDVIAEGGIICPNCGEPLEFDLSELDDDECDCGCEDHHIH